MGHFGLQSDISVGTLEPAETPAQGDLDSVKRVESGAEASTSGTSPWGDEWKVRPSEPSVMSALIGPKEAMRSICLLRIVTSVAQLDALIERCHPMSYLGFRGLMSRVYPIIELQLAHVVCQTRWSSRQCGVVRYNCADSLDRTNAASYFGAVQVGLLSCCSCICLITCAEHMLHTFYKRLLGRVHSANLTQDPR